MDTEMLHAYKHIFLINPNTSKKQIKQNMAMNITKICENDELDYEIYWAKSPEDAVVHVTEIAKMQKKLRVYICGGDGTISNIINGTYQYKNIEFAIIPIGSGNDTARSLGELKDSLDIRKVVYGEADNVDLIRFNDKICVNMLNIGFDEQVVSFVQKRRHNPIMRCSFAYTLAALVKLASMPMEHTKITFDDGTVVDQRFTLSCIANGAYCGGGYFAASNARIDDGLMDVLVVKPIHRLTFIKIIDKYKKGTILNTPIGKKMIIQKKCKSLVMEKEEEFEVCWDGDIIKTKRLECSMIPQAIKMITPLKGSIL